MYPAKNRLTGLLTFNRERKEGEIVTDVKQQIAGFPGNCYVPVKQGYIRQ